MTPGAERISRIRFPILSTVEGQEALMKFMHLADITLWNWTIHCTEKPRWRMTQHNATILFRCNYVRRFKIIYEKMRGSVRGDKTHTREEVDFESFLGYCVVWFEFQSHVVAMWCDYFGLLWATEFAMQLGVRSQPTTNLDIVIFTHLPRQKAVDSE